MATEFELIRRHFTLPTRHTVLGVGDDAAVLAPRAGMEVVVSSDMLVAGTHFFADTDPVDLGWKALAVNLSDLAAMGADPRWAVLALALPAADEAWVARFAQGFAECAAHYDVDLVGGDTTRGPLTLAVTLIGEVERGRAIQRHGAQPGDSVWVTGTPGRAALGLAMLKGEIRLHDAFATQCLGALQRPLPRVEAGRALVGIATAMLDISDGLLGDLGHILERSSVGADIMMDALPIDAPTEPNIERTLLERAVLCGGDDYELLFCAPLERGDAIARLSSELALPITRIGQITSQAGHLELVDAAGKRTPARALGYDHFRA